MWYVPQLLLLILYELVCDIVFDNHRNAHSNAGSSLLLSDYVTCALTLNDAIPSTCRVRSVNEETKAITISLTTIEFDAQQIPCQLQQRPKRPLLKRVI